MFIVSICCITYNHEPFIAQTIEGVLMQQVNFQMEFIIAEDCSTDNTKKIVLDYANRYPELIKVITSENNVGAVANERRAMIAAHGKYIAFCEGDDYWTDPLKLQKQVDFMETHPEYSVCFHRLKHFDTEKNILIDDSSGFLFENNEQIGVDISSKIMMENDIALLPLAMLFRRESLDSSLEFQYKYYRDFHQIYHLLQAGKGYLFAFYGGIRNLHAGGIFNSLSLYSRYQINLFIAEEVFNANKTNDLKLYYIRTIQNCIYSYAGDLNHKWMAFYLSIKLFAIQKSVHRLGANIKRVIKSIL